MRKLFPALLMVLILLPLEQVRSQTDKLKSPAENLLDTDKKFALTASVSGISQAYKKFCLGRAFILPNNGHPISIAEIDNYTSASDNLFYQRTGPWKPESAQVSAAADLGYSVGRCKPGTGSKSTPVYYATVWARDKQGKWKIVFSQGLFILKQAIKTIRPANISLNTQGPEKVIIQAELNFSAYSAKHGIARAFFRFIADSGIALSSSGPPRTKKTYQNLITRSGPEKNRDSLDWQPIFSFLSQSRDLGYNFGPYIYSQTQDQGKIIVSRGYFMTVWKKQADKKWRFVLDCGNSLQINSQ